MKFIIFGLLAVISFNVLGNNQLNPSPFEGNICMDVLGENMENAPIIMDKARLGKEMANINEQVANRCEHQGLLNSVDVMYKQAHSFEDFIYACRSNREDIVHQSYDFLNHQDQERVTHRIQSNLFMVSSKQMTKEFLDLYYEINYDDRQFYILKPEHIECGSIQEVGS